MIRKTATYIVFLILASVLLYLSFREIKWDDFIYGLSTCSYTWIAMSMITSVVTCWFRALRWKLLLKPINPEIGTRETFDGINIGYMTNFLIPRAGELSRCGVIAATGKAGFEATLGSVITERVADILSLGIVFASMFFVNRSEFGTFMKDNIIDSASGRLGTTAVIALSAIAASIAAITVTASIPAGRKFLSGMPLFRFIGKSFLKIKDGLTAGLKLDNLWKFLFHTVMIWVCYWLMSYFTILAFPAVGFLDAGDAMFLMVAGSLGWLVPVQGGLGAYHFIVSLALNSVYGINMTDGVIFATISHTSQSLIMILCGIYSFISAAAYRKKRKA